jgi:ribulose-5-phosphate 4-epimerase/fuculose-1-phosphate aldolase
MLRRKRNSLTSGNCTLRDEKEPMVFWAKSRSMLRRKGNSLTSGNCTLRDGKEAMVRLLGDEMVCLCCVGRGTA